MSELFSRFWETWPSNTSTYTRKGCRAECFRRWTMRGLDAEANHIIAHVTWLKSTEQWQQSGGQFIPAPLVYLNQSRWDGAEIPETPAEARERIRAAEELAIRRSIEGAPKQETRTYSPPPAKVLELVQKLKAGR